MVLYQFWAKNGFYIFKYNTLEKVKRRVIYDVKIMSINKSLIGRRPRSFAHVVTGLHTAMADLSGCHRNNVACKARSIYVFLYWKGLLTFDLSDGYTDVHCTVMEIFLRFEKICRKKLPLESPQGLNENAESQAPQLRLENWLLWELKMEI